MKKLVAALVITWGLTGAASAQNFTMPPPAGVVVGGLVVVASCGGQTLTAGKPAFATMDTTGTLCTVGGSGGTSYTVNYGSPIGTKGTPGGFEDSSGNFQPFQGSATNGLYVDCQSASNTLCGLINSPLPAQSNHTTNIGAVDSINQYPAGAVPITASAIGTTAATTATLAGTTGKTTYICGYSIRANAAAATTVTNTLTGVISGTMSSIMWIAPAASGIGVDEPPTFTPCIPASAANTAISAVSGAPGTGGNVSVKAWGYQL